MSQTEPQRVTRGRQYDTINKEYLQNKPPQDCYEYNWRDRPFTHAIVLHPHDPGWKRADGRKNKVLSQAEWRIWLQRDYDLKKSQYRPENNEAQNDFQVQTRRYSKNILSVEEHAPEAIDDKAANTFNSPVFQENNYNPHVAEIRSYRNRFDPADNALAAQKQQTVPGNTTQSQDIKGKAADQAHSDQQSHNSYSTREDDVRQIRCTHAPEPDRRFNANPTAEPQMFHMQQRIKAPRTEKMNDIRLRDLEFQNQQRRAGYNDFDTPCVEVPNQRANYSPYRNQCSTPSYLTNDARADVGDKNFSREYFPRHVSRRHHHHHHSDRYRPQSSHHRRHNSRPESNSRYAADRFSPNNTPSVLERQCEHNPSQTATLPCMCPYFSEMMMLDNAGVVPEQIQQPGSQIQKTLMRPCVDITQRQTQEHTPEPVQQILNPEDEIITESQPIGRTRRGIVV